MVNPKYIIDSSALITAKNSLYPFQNFPRFWNRLAQAAIEGTIAAPLDVFDEIVRRDDDISTWTKANKDNLFIPLDQPMIEHVKRILRENDGVINPHAVVKSSSGDIFVVAMALHFGASVISEERWAKKKEPPHIPDVCAKYGIRCIKILDLLKSENWIVG